MKKILTLLLVMVLALTAMVSCDKIPGLDKVKLPELKLPFDLPWQKDEPADDDKKDDVVTPAEDADLKAAYDFVHNTVKEIAEKTNANYTLPGVAPVKDKNYTVTWTVSDERIKLEVSEDGAQVTVVVPEPGDADIPYVLKFVVANEKNETLSREYTHIVPKYQVNTYAEYRAAKKGDALVVEGVVYGIMSKAAGDAENSVFVQDLTCGGGYYVYQVSDETVASVALGQTVKVKGNKEVYYDLPEIVDATIEVVKTEVTTLTPTDITEVYKSVDNATDKDSPLLDYVGGYITIKGVTLLEAGTNGYYYFELDGVKTYFRISSSSNCTTKDEETTIKNNFNNNFYHTADITGIATLYKSGEDYCFNVMPLTGDMLSNFSEEMQPMPDDVKANFILDKLTVPSEMVSTVPVVLPLVGTSVVNMSVFEDVDIAWTLAETANATLADGTLTAVLPESGSVEITLTAKVLVNNTAVEKNFTVVVKYVETTSIPTANDVATKAGSAYTTDKYIVEGFITSIANGKYGNVYIKDANDNELYIYGIYSAYGDLRFDALESAPKVGDKVVLYGVLGTYTDKSGKTTIQMKNAWLLSWEHVHTYNTKGETVEATCGDGYTIYSCYCGLEEKRDIVKGTGEHEIEENTFWHPELEAATCTTTGVRVFECANCDYYYTEVAPIDPEAHAFWGDEEILTNADCVTKTDGSKKVYCTRCDAYEVKPIYYSAAHDWAVDVDTQPTCTVDGAYHAVCTLCQEVEEYSRPAEGHFAWGLACGQTGECVACGEEFTVEHDTRFNPATCTQAAFCMNCMQYVGEPLGHDWDETDPTSVCSRCGLMNHVCDFSVKGETTAPTCTEGGYTVYHCSQEGCNATENKDLTEATNHEGTTEEKEAVAPTCSAVGYTAGVYCTACQTWVSGHEEQPIVADAHKNEDGDALCDNGCGTIMNYGTLEAPLTTTQVANGCANLTAGSYSAQKFYITGTVTKITYDNGTYYSKVYITDGNTEFYIYSVNLTDAGAFTKGDIVVVYGYVMNYENSDGTTILEFTSQTIDGTKVYPEAVSVVDTCANGHSYSDGACDATSICSVCGAAKGDHSYDEGVVTTAATCLAVGVKTYTCACTATKTEDVAKLEHSYTGEGGVCVNGCGLTEENAPAEKAWSKASSIAVGDVVTLVCETKGMEYNGLNSTNVGTNTYGNGVAYTDNIAGTVKLTVVAGATEGTYAFMTEDGTYLAWVSGKNNLTSKTAIDNYCSWTVTFDANGDAVILNVADSARKLQWNAGSPRFSAYTSTQTAIQLYVYA